MKNLLDKTTQNLNKIILGFLIFIIIFYFFTLFIGSFNLLKFLIFLGLIFLSLTLLLYIYFLKQPQEEKISFFNLFQNLLDHLSESIVIYDRDFKIVFVNKSFSELVGLKKEDLINFTVSQGLLKSEKYEMLANLFFPFLQGDDLKIINKEPEIIQVHFLKPKEKYFLISYFDIFLEKPYKLRAILDKTQDVLESQQRLEFVHLVSHNLLTPLNQIRWFLESVNQEELSETNKEFITSSLNILKNTLIFTESILAFVRTETGRLALKIEEIDLEKIFLQILDILKDKINEKKLKISLEISEGEEKALGDQGLLFAALFALIENAVVYNKIGGSLEIIIRKQVQRPYREIIIKDTGIGMNQEDLNNLFKKYYRGKKAKDLEIKGFGLGLYNAKTILNLHGGEIKVESQEDKGTTVTLLLPLNINLIPKSS